MNQKEYLLLNIDDLYNFEKINNIDNINIFSFDKNRFPNLHNICVVDNYNTESINMIIENQKKDNSKPVLLVFDDCININIKDDATNLVEKILIEGKQLNIFTIIVQQCVFGFNPIIKNNIDVIYAFKESYYVNLRKVYEYYEELFDYNAFLYLINKLDNYECIVSYKFNNKQKIGFYKVNNIN